MEKMTRFSLLFISIFFAQSCFSQSNVSQNPDAVCRYYRDGDQVVHWVANDKKSFYQCWGYFHFQDRGWQMQWLKRIALGRTAEINGFSGLKKDVIFRLLQLDDLADRIFKESSIHTQNYLRAYANGVNDAISETKVFSSNSPWLKLKDIPEPWRPQDSVLILLLQSFDQTRKAFEKQIQAERAKNNNKAIIDLIPNNLELPWEIPILIDLESKSTVSNIQLSSPENENTGSNNWVVSAKRSGSGTAWLANDPHLALKSPSFWYWIQPSLNNKQWFGASIPGLPTIPSGISLKMAWGLTNAYLDFAEVVDVPVSEIEADLTSEYPLIWVKWGFLKFPFFFKKLQYFTSRFPILPIESKKDHLRILNWSGYQYSGASLDALFKFHESETITEMDQNLKATQISGWNFVFASTEGKIGYRATGLALKPLDINERSNDPVPVINRKTLESRTFLKPDEMPTLSDPKSGIIITANHRHWNEGGRAYSPGFRGWRIRQLLNASSEPLGFTEHQRIQCDDYASDAFFLMPLLRQNLGSLWKQYPEIHELFLNWDYQTSENCRSCLLYRRWMDRVSEDMSLSESQLYAVLLSTSANSLILTGLETAFKNMLKDLDLEGKEPRAFPVWGEKHRLYLRHMSDSAIMETGHSIGSPGDNQTVDPGTADWVSDKKEYEHRSGASFRTVIELSNPPRIRKIFPGLQNQDEEMDFDKLISPVNRWKNCELDEAEFPFDMSKAITEKAFLKSL